MKPACGLALLGFVACGDGRADPGVPAPRAVLPAPAVDPAPEACGRCHTAEWEAWRGSMHARAWDDPVFRLEYESRPAESCRDCHAPPSSAPGRRTGIDCATCHVHEGEILAVTISDEGTRAHPMRRAPELRTSENCGRCHQFAFIPDGVHDPSEALQNTLQEHYGSEAYARGQTCLSCHMPRGSHAFPGIHDPVQLARAVEVEVAAARVATGIEVDVTIAGAEIGHAFPTGDVFRRAVLRVATASGANATIEMQRWLARSITEDGEDLLVRTVDDTRVPAPGQGVLRETLHLPDTAATAVTWELVLHRLPPERAGERGLDAAIVTRPVARGEVTVSPAAP
jgi:hypothetical protein